MTDLRELRRLEPWFWLAPSAHNTQPWLLDYAPERIELSYDPARHLHASDRTQRDLFLGLGAFVECVLIAAPELSFEPRLDGTRVGTFTAGTYTTPFTREDLERRRTSRLPYADGRFRAEALAAARAQLDPGERLHELPARALIGLFARADRHAYATPPVVDELRAWLRLDRSDPRYEQDGLTYECLDLSPLEARALALLLRPRVLPLARRALTASARRVLDVDGSVLVLEGGDDVLAAGRSLLRAWLALSRDGYRTHPLSQILDCDETARELAARLAPGPGRSLLSVFRAGVSEPPPRSHRLVER
jgi:hypothetical protein